MADQHLPAAPSPRDNIYAVLHIHVIYNQDNNRVFLFRKWLHHYCNRWDTMENMMSTAGISGVLVHSGIKYSYRHSPPYVVSTFQKSGESQNWVYIRSHTYTHRRQSRLKSSTIFISLHFHSHNKKSLSLSLSLFLCFLFLSLKLCNLKLCKSGQCVNTVQLNFNSSINP